MSDIVLSASSSPEPAVAAVDRRPARHHPEPPCHRQEGQHRARQSDQLLHRRRRSTPAPATSTTCSTASATACRSCRPPTPASPRCRSWSTPRSRSPTRRCRPTVGYSTKSVVHDGRRSPVRPPTTCWAGAHDRQHGLCRHRRQQPVRAARRRRRRRRCCRSAALARQHRLRRSPTAIRS